MTRQNCRRTRSSAASCSFLSRSFFGSIVFCIAAAALEIFQVAVLWPGSGLHSFCELGKSSSACRDSDAAASAPPSVFLLSSRNPLTRQFSGISLLFVGGAIYERTVTMEYRAHAGSQIWHFCSKCSQWPKEFNLIVTDTRPADHRLCIECKDLSRKKAPDRSTSR